MHDNRRQAKIQIDPGRASVAALLSAATVRDILKDSPPRTFSRQLSSVLSIRAFTLPKSFVP
jgi:hypothetical protein